MANGSDKDTDRRPGGASESREYSRKFDPRTEQEYTNLIETSNRLEADRIDREIYEQAEEAAFAASLDAQSSVQFFPSVGKFIIPKENTWAAHAQIVKDNRRELYFNPEKYVYFDRIIAKKFGDPALYNSLDPNYPKYEGLRTNLEVLRNDIIGMYLDDGSFDPGDEKFIPHISGIATALGNALANDVWWKRPFVSTVSVDVANVEGVGAREMYNYLLEMQIPPAGKLQGLRRHINALLGISPRVWELPPLEATPFSPRALAAPPPEPEICFPADTVMQDVAPTEAALGTDRERALAFSENALRSAKRMSGITTLAQPAKDTSVEEARTILRWLKNLQFGEKTIEEWLDQGTPAEQLSKVEMLGSLVVLYENGFLDALKRRPELASDWIAQDAGEAASAIALALERYAQRLTGHTDRDLAALAATLPAHAQLKEEEPTGRLLAALGRGFTQLSPGIAASPAERLIDTGNRIDKTARKLRSIDALEEPTREESIELAREILRRLRNMTFSNKSLQDVIDTGRPEENAALAEKLGEMVDIYKNLLFEAAQIDPGIMLDTRVKDANDAAGGLAHAIKLMAAKEIPTSISAAQQISADVTQMPEEWKKLHDRTVDRLVTSMEGGLEKAVGDIALQQAEEQAQDEEQAQEMVESALLTSDQLRRKKRKRRSSSRSGFGGKKQRRQHLDLTADDYVLKQGRFAQHKETLEKIPAAVPALRPEDIAAIRELGGSLRSINTQAKDLPSLTNVATDDKITPDDRTLAQRQTERTEQEKQPGQRPRV